MMKNENGITLIALVITIIVTLILVGTGLTITFNEIDDSRNNELWTELGTVRQAVVEQYQKKVLVGKIGILKEAEENVFPGNIIDNQIGDRIFIKASTNQLKQKGLLSEDGNTRKYMANYDYNNNCTYKEDCCYLLVFDDSNVWEQLEIENNTYSYVVNYKTGEVYNYDKNEDYSGKLLYLAPINYSNQITTTDTQNFSDWNNGFDD